MNRRAGGDGFALMDVLVSTLIASIALATALGGIALSARSAGRIDERLHRLIEVENEDARGRRLEFRPTLLQQ